MTESEMPAKPLSAPKKAAKPAAPGVAEEQKNVEKSLRASIREGGLNAASNSIFSTFLVPLALALKGTNLQIGLMNTAQNIGATAGQVPGAKLTEHYNRKAIWLAVQLVAKVALWVPIILLPFLGLQDPVAALIVLAALSSFFLAVRAPAWASLMGDIVPAEKRGAYFGKRNMITGFSGILVTLAAGFMIALLGFPAIFAAGVALSVLSVPIFMRMYEPPARKVFHYRHAFSFRPREWHTSIKLNMRLSMFTAYMAIFNFGVEIAGPYYAVFMLRNLGISYEAFAVLTIAGALARMLSFKYWGRLNDTFGSRNILVITGFFAVFTPFGWLFVSNAWHILAVKIFDGFIWAGFDQVAFNYLLDVTPAKKRPQYIANHSFIAGLGVILGAAAGGLLAESVQSASLFWLGGLQIVFLASFAVRLGAAAMLAKVKDADVRQSQVMPVRYVFWRTMAVEPATGLKNVMNFTFRYPFNRDAAYMRAVRRARLAAGEESRAKQKADGNKKLGGDSKPGKA